jgi:hypothetical protein
MSRSFDMSASYDGGVEQVHRAFGDRQYWLARLADSGADDATLDSMTVGSDGVIDVITTQTLWASRLPGLVAQFHHGDLSFVREETWSPVLDGQADATVKGSIRGAPATLSGAAKLVRNGAGSHLDFTATVEVRIPLVGGKVESFIGSQLVELLIAEQRFTTEWIKSSAS